MSSKENLPASLSNDLNAIELLDSFLSSKNIFIKKNRTMNETIRQNYDLLNDDILKSIANQVISDRDSNVLSRSNSGLLGEWEIVIDSIKEITMEKRKQASNNLEKLISIGNQSDPSKLIKFINILYNVNQLDRLLKELINEAKLSCIDNNMSDMALMFDFILKNVEIVETENRNKPIKPIEKSNQNNFDQEKLIQSGEYLNNLLIQFKGDMIGLTNAITSDYERNTLDILSFIKVLDDNINACKMANYMNKLKVFEFILEHIKLLKQNDLSNDDIDDNRKYLHAPQFVEKNISDEQYEIITPEQFLDCSNYSMSILNNDIKNSKKKIEKKYSKSKVSTLSDLVAEQLQNNSYAVCDNFLPLDLIRRAKIEANLFIDYYEQSEIWLGKDSDVGAHLVVPSVRGDKVLWMCGGHNGAPEGVSRTIKMSGEIEPCRLEVKAAAPVRRFNAMKEVINAIDKLIHELIPRVHKLNGIYERSDVMLAVYPGGGSRFAKHIDNTTNDGRRMTVLLYLNPGWTVEKGGALRLTTSNEDNSVKYVDILPLSGRLAMFYSSEMPHEVLPTYDNRFAITIWYYDSTERAEALNFAKSTGRSALVSKSSLDSQMLAQSFISELISGNQETDESISNEIVRLGQKLNQLSDESVGIIASVIGVASATELRNGFQYMTPADLNNMRASFCRMGLNN